MIINHSTVVSTIHLLDGKCRPEKCRTTWITNDKDHIYIRMPTRHQF